MTDTHETALSLLASGSFRIEPGQRGDRECPPALAAPLVEIAFLWADGIDSEGRTVQIDVLPSLPAEVRRALQQQVEREVERESRERAERARAEEYESRSA